MIENATDVAARPRPQAVFNSAQLGTGRAAYSDDMLSKVFLSSAIVLGLLSLAWPAQLGLQLLVALTASLAAVFAAVQAGGHGRYLWLCAFVLMAALLNPAVPVPLSRVTSLLVLAMSLAVLASWQAILRRTVHGPSVSQVLHS
jgi:hypothetical protein